MAPNIYYKAVRLDRTSHYDKATRWKVGETVTVTNPDPPENGPCGRGIHCSPTLLDAVNYQRGPSRYATVEPIDIIATDASKVRCRAVRVVRWLHQAEQDELAGFKLWETNHPVNPLLRKSRDLDKQTLLRRWASVQDSVGDSVGASVEASVGASVQDSVQDSVWDSVGDFVQASVGASMRAFVRASVGDFVRVSVWAYIGGMFPGIVKWKYAEALGPDPWRPLLTLWYGGHVPSFDGATWRLHAGRNAEVVHEWTPEEVNSGDQ